MNPPSLTFLNLLDVTALPPCGAFLFNEAVRAWASSSTIACAHAAGSQSRPASPIARGLGKDAHACPPMLDPAGRAFSVDSVFMPLFCAKSAPPSHP